MCLLLNTCHHPTGSNALDILDLNQVPSHEASILVFSVPNAKNLKYLRFDTCNVQCTFLDDLCPIIHQIQHYLSLECFLKPSSLILLSPQIFYKNSFVLGGTMKSKVACIALLFFRLVCNRILQVINIHIIVLFFGRVRLDPILTQDLKCT